jgi:hypothetical protein
MYALLDNEQIAKSLDALPSRIEEAIIKSDAKRLYDPEESDMPVVSGTVVMSPDLSLIDLSEAAIFAHCRGIRTLRHLQYVDTDGEGQTILSFQAPS